MNIFTFGKDSETGNSLFCESADLTGSDGEKFVRLVDAQSELAALREELANHDSASLLMNAWVAEHKSQMPWDKAIELISIVTKMPDEEKQRLLCLDDQYELISTRLAAAEQRNADTIAKLELAASMMDDDERGNRFAEVCRLAIASLKSAESGASE